MAMMDSTPREAAADAVAGIWLREHAGADTHVAFRGTFELASATEVAITCLGGSWWEAHLDGVWMEEGAPRYHPSCPEHVVLRRQLPSGRHVISIHAHQYGVHTRLQRELPAFISCRVHDGRGVAVAMSWRARHLAGYHSQVARINPQLGWIDWLDSRQEPVGWREPRFDDATWQVPDAATVPLGASRAAQVQLQGRSRIPLQAQGSGELQDTFGYERDDPAVRFLLRSLEPELPAQGIWRRYDLGRVRLGRPCFTIDLPAGAVVEWALSEQLHQGRVHPFITLSAGRSCNLDHIVARGGPQEFTATAAKGGRYLELHIISPVRNIRILQEAFLERAYFGAQRGSFSCPDQRLNAVWNLGVATLRSCSEDAVCDNPTRERGQWTGDALIGMETSAVAFGDYALARRALQQAAIDARPDGLVSGLSPADSLGVTTYAMQWVGACLRYHEISGDRSLLQELHGAARRNLEALRRGEDAEGLSDRVGWGFVDWGYARPSAPVDLAVNLHYLDAIRALQSWCERLGESAEAQGHAEHAQHLQRCIQAHLGRILGAEPDWRRVGYHVAALALRGQLLDRAQRPSALAYLREHLLACFPNDPSAPRLSDPGVSESRLITPYFAHYAFTALAEGGCMDFVLEQYRRCWGWMLDLGATTCLEVFDTRWSHCHQWAACPTWQLSRFCLGIEHCGQLGHRHLRVHAPLGSLPGAQGVLPLAGGALEVSWSRGDQGIEYALSTDVPVVVHLGRQEIPVERAWRHHFPLEAASA
jgi:alpha-L-rhamnosidase